MDRPTDTTGGGERRPAHGATPPSAPVGDASGVLGGVGAFDRALARWTADARVDDAARARQRERWLRTQGDEEANLGGVLLDLAEAGRPVLLDAGDQRLRGRIVGLGADFAALRTDQGRHALVRLSAVDAVQTQPGERPVVGDRWPLLEVDLAGVVGPIAGDRPQVAARTRGGAVIRGELRSASTSLLRLRTRTEPPGSAWLPLDALVVLILEP